jgi:hypothetical protein
MKNIKSAGRNFVERFLVRERLDIQKKNENQVVHQMKTNRKLLLQNHNTPGYAPFADKGNLVLHSDYCYERMYHPHHEKYCVGCRRQLQTQP